MRRLIFTSLFSTLLFCFAVPKAGLHLSTKVSASTAATFNQVFR